MLGGKLKLALRAHHAGRVDAADGRLAERHIEAGHIRPRRGKHDDQPFPRVRRAADDLHHAGAGLDLAHAQLIGVGMRLRFEHVRDCKVFQLRRRVLDAFDLKADERQLCRNFVEGSLGLQMIFEPREREFHGSAGERCDEAMRCSAALSCFALLERKCFVTILAQKQPPAATVKPEVSSHIRLRRAPNRAGRNSMPSGGCGFFRLSANLSQLPVSSTRNGRFRCLPVPLGLTGRGFRFNLCWAPLEPGPAKSLNRVEDGVDGNFDSNFRKLIARIAQIGLDRTAGQPLPGHFGGIAASRRRGRADAAAGLWLSLRQAAAR